MAFVPCRIAIGGSLNRMPMQSIGDFGPLECPSRSDVVNWAFRGHGHEFLWDIESLTRELERVGFGAVRRMPFGASSLLGAAIEGRESEAFYSLIVEAVAT